MRGTPTCSFFFFNDTATTEIYTLSLHDALPISGRKGAIPEQAPGEYLNARAGVAYVGEDRKSTRLNSSHSQISYAVFCLKKKRPSYRASRSHARAAPHGLTHTTSLYAMRHCRHA